MDQAQRSNRVADWCTWAACALVVVGALMVIGVPWGGTNRVIGVAVPFGIAAVALAATPFLPDPTGWLRGLVYALATLAVLYGMLLALSLPVRLAVQGTCPPTTATCPLGFERPSTSAETFAVYAAATCGALALAFVFIAVEMRYVHRSRPRIDRSIPPPP